MAATPSATKTRTSIEQTNLLVGLSEILPQLHSMKNAIPILRAKLFKRFGDAVFGVFVLTVTGLAADAADLAVPDNVVFEPGIEYSNPDNQHLQLNLVRPKNGHGPFPAIVCIHGTQDKYVAYEQASWLVDRLKACDVEVELLTLEGAGHGFKGADEEKANKAMLAFFEKHLRPDKN